VLSGSTRVRRYRDPRSLWVRVRSLFVLFMLMALVGTGMAVGVAVGVGLGVSAMQYLINHG
jgi:hypothetical protein